MEHDDIKMEKIKRIQKVYCVVIVIIKSGFLSVFRFLDLVGVILVGVFQNDVNE